MNVSPRFDYGFIEPKIVTPLSFTAAAITERGRKRQENEDTILHYIGETLNREPFGLFIVSDGMGGHQAGKYASQTAVQIVGVELAPVLSTADELTPVRLEQTIRRAMARANERLWQQSQSKTADHFKMGTTMTLALIVSSRLHVAHVGNSRAYLWRLGKLIQLTQDHSLVAELAQQLPMTFEQMQAHPYRGLITRSLGSQETVAIDYVVQEIQPGDRVLLCSNGLWKLFREAQDLSRELASSGAPTEQCQSLLAAAHQRTPSDDISLIISHCHNALDQYHLTSNSLFFPQNPSLVG